MMVFVLPAGHLFQWNHAAFPLLATQMLKLDGGVADMKVLVQQVIEPA